MLFTAVAGVASIYSAWFTPSDRHPQPHPTGDNGAFPWIFTGYSTGTGSMMLAIEVGDYALSLQQRRIVLSYSALYDLHLTILSVRSVIPNGDSYNQCLVSDIRDPEYVFEGYRPIAVVGLTEADTILRVEAHARNGSWFSTITARRKRGVTEGDEAMVGHFFDSKGISTPMFIGELRNRAEPPATVLTLRDRRSDDRAFPEPSWLVSHGLPRQTREEFIRQGCPSFSLSQ